MVTNGSKEGYILNFGKVIEKIKPTIQKNIENTVGAGDTFLSNFFIKYIQTKNISSSLNFALEKIDIFLKEINRSES